MKARFTTMYRSASTRWLGMMMAVCYVLLCATGMAQKGNIAPSENPEQPESCAVDVVIVTLGTPVHILFEPALQTKPGEQLVYETLSGQFLFTSPSDVVYVPLCTGWDFVQIRAVDGLGHSHVVARVDFIVDDESQLQTTYDLTAEAEGRGYLLPLNAGSTQYAAIWLSDFTPQAPGRPGRGGRICLPRPKIPPGKTCASLHPDPNHPSNWVCTPWYQAFCYTRQA